MSRDELMADRCGVVALLEESPNRDEVAEGLGHLAALDLQMLHVQPVARERLSGRRLGLRDLVLVMGEDQVLAAEVHVESLAELLQTHHGALEVPPRPAPPPR